MLEKYKNLIYDNENDKKEVEDTCIELVCKRHPDIPKEDIIQEIEQDEGTDICYDYFLEMTMIEGKRLLSLVREKYGIPLWNSKAWKQKSCKKHCPYGDTCTKQLLKIDDEYFCFGQLFLKGITNKKHLQAIINSHHIELVNTKTDYVIDVNKAFTENMEFELSYLSDFFFKYLWCSIWFGDGYGEKIIETL